MNKNTVLAVLVISALLTAFLSNDLYLPSMPLLQHYFSVSANTMQITEGIWFAGAMTLQLLIGPLSDTYGRKPILLISLLLLLLASLLCAWSSTIVLFMIGRFLQGVASSGIMVTSYAAIHESADDGEGATKALGYVGMATAMAPIVGPLIGGYCTAYIGWRMTFYLVVILAGLCIFMGKLYFTESNQKTKSFDKKKTFKVYKELLCDPVFLSSVACYSLMFFAGGAFLSGIPFVMVDILDQPIQHVGYAIVPLLITYMIGAGYTGHLLKHIKPMNIIFIALLIASAAMLWFNYASVVYQPSLRLVIACVGLYYMGLGFSGPHLNHISLDCNDDYKGAASALLTMSMMFGCTAGSFLLSVIYNNHLYALSSVMNGAVLAALFCAGLLHFAKANVDVSNKLSEVKS